MNELFYKNGILAKTFYVQSILNHRELCDAHEESVHTSAETGNLLESDAY
jgi:hypothetical protein